MENSKEKKENDILNAQEQKNIDSKDDFINSSQNNYENLINNSSLSPNYKSSIQSIKTITGTITAEYINDYVFTQEYYKYNNNLNKDNYATKKEKEKKFREKLKKTRAIYNDPKSSDFTGPWAKYKDEINFEEEKELNKINVKTEEHPETNILDYIKNNEKNND